MFWMKKVKEHKIVIISEFKPDAKSEKIISELSDYISGIIRQTDTILTDLQFVPTGYRVTYTITFLASDKKKKYVKELSKLSNWLGKSEVTGCISRYHYNYV